MRFLTLAALSALCVLLMSVAGHGQQAPGQPQAVPPGAEGEAAMMPAAPFSMTPPPLTRIEAFGAQRGVLIIKGFTEVGHLNGDDGSAIRVMAVQFTDGAKQARERGLAIQVSQNSANGAAPTETLSYVDEDEVDALIENVGQLGKLAGDSTVLDAFEGRYQTRGELEFANINANGARMISVRGAQFFPTTGQPGWATAMFFPARMEEFRQRLDAARQVLGRLREAK